MMMDESLAADFLTKNGVSHKQILNEFIIDGTPAFPINECKHQFMFDLIGSDTNGQVVK